MKFQQKNSGSTFKKQRINKKFKQKSLSSLKTITLIGALILFLLPFFIIVMNSFKTTQKFVDEPFSLPESLQITNYVSAFNNMNFLQGLLNSSIITITSVLFVVIFSSMTGYLFARFKWKINNILFFVIIASMTLPFQVIMIPLVILYGDLELLNSRLTLIYMHVGFGIPLGVFFFHGFIKSIPYELEESAFIEGCSRFKTFILVVFPLLKPIVVTLSILDILAIWNDYLLPSLILLSPEMRTLPLSIYTFFSTYSVDYGPLMAGLIMTIIPILLVYLFMQKHIIKGITEGALK